MKMLAAFILVLLTAIVSAQPLGDSTVSDEVATRIINLAVTTKKVKVKGKSKLRKGSLAGLIVGILIAVIILAIIAFILYKRAQKKKALGVTHEPKMVGGSSTVHESAGGVPLQQRNEAVAHV